MSKVICSPGCYIQGNGELKKLADYCAKAGANKAYLLIDKFIYDTYKDNIESSFKVKCLRYTMEIFGGECSEKEIRKHQNALGQSDIVIGIGGSYLGARAAIEFLKSPNYNNMKKDTPDIYFTGNSISSTALTPNSTR